LAASLMSLAIGCSGDASDGDYSDGGDEGYDSGWGDGDGDGDSGGDGDGDGEGGDDEGDPEGDPEDKPDPDDGEDVCDEDMLVTLYLSPDDSNSMSSPVQARETILSGGYKFPVRVWEFLNYYSFDYPEAAPDEVTLRAELRDAGDGEYYLQIGVGSEKVTDEDRAPLNLTLVLDESGSMAGTPIEMLKESCRAIAANLKEGDIVSLVTWDTDNAVLLGGYSVSGPNDPTLLDRIEGIASGGGTDLQGGLEAGYGLAAQSFDPDRINRIVLISDGGANVGVTDEELIGNQAGGENEEGIYMVGVGVGTSTYNDLLMDTVTDWGKGASVFIPDQEEAWKIFGDDFVNTLDVAVRDVQVQVDLPPGFSIIEFSGEEWSPNPEEIEPQHLAPNDTMVFLQKIGSCAPELVTDESEISVTVRYKDARTFEEKELTATRSFGQLLAETSPQLEKGLAVFRYAQAVGGETTVQDAMTQLEVAEGLLSGDEDLAEIRTVLEAL
jgi:Ca-activated chloride channel family protein